MILEYLYLTVHYACGCDALRPIRRQDYAQDFPLHARIDDRDIGSLKQCPTCKESRRRARERKLESRGVM